MEELKKIGGKNTCTSAIIIKNDKILLGLRHYTPDKFKKVSVWTTPGGRCNKGESVEENLRREVLEETGITDLKIGKFLGEVEGAKKGDALFVFYCTTDQDAKLTEPDKFSAWKWFDFYEIPDKFLNPRILPLIEMLA